MTSETKETRLPHVPAGMWGGFEGGECIGSIDGLDDDPSGAARLIAAKHWASGTHRISVVSATEMHTFDVTLSVEVVSDPA